MSDTAMVVEVLRPARRKLLGLMPAKSKATLPEGREAFKVTDSVTTGREIQRISSGDVSGALRPAADGFILAVSKTPVAMALTYSALTKDKDGHAWDLTLAGTWAVADSRRFLEAYALDAVSPDSGLSAQVTESWVAQSIRPRVLDGTKGYSVPDLREKDALPARWWESQLHKWLGEYGLTANVSEARWESADAERAEAERRRTADMEQIEQEQKRERQSEIREIESRAEYEREKVRIEQDVKLSEAEKTHELHILEIRHRKELLEAEAEVEEARRARERAALGHEVAVAKLKNDLAAVASAEERQTELAEREDRIADSLAKAQETIERLAGISEPLLQQLANQTAKNGYQAAERLVSPEFGFTAAQLTALGFDVGRQSLVELLAEKAKQDGDTLALQKQNLVTRDIGAAKVKALPIGKSLQFKLESKRAGFITVLNLGTSGTAYVHVPNGLIADKNIRIADRKSYLIPGKELFPWEWDYREEGPAGWEHIVGIVSDAPVLPDTITGRSTTEAPIVKLRPDELDGVFSTLNDLPAESWSAGVLSFLVG